RASVEVAIAPAPHGADGDEPARAPRLARGDPAGRLLRDHRRAGAGCVRDRGAGLRPLRPRRGRLRDRRAHGSGRPQDPRARHRGDGHRADSLGRARTPPARWERSPGEDAMSRRLVALALLGVVVVVVGAYGVRVWRYWDRHVSTDDAFVEAHISPVSARVRGTVVQVLASDNQQVPAGARLVARRAAVQATTADVAARQADFDRADLDRGRMQELLDRGLVSRQEFDHTESAFKTAGAALEAARRRLDMARAEVAQAEAEVA